MRTKILIICLTLLATEMNFAQSVAYKTLLKGVYDKDFPIVKPSQEEILSNAVLLDTREKNEFDVSHLKGAIWVGFDTFSLDSVKDLPKDQTLVVYCSIGARSQDIGKKLKEAGFKDVYNLYGGIFHWVNNELPVFDQVSQTNRVHAFSRSWGIWLKRGVKVY